MKRRMVSAMTLTLLLTSMAMLAFHVQPVRAEGAIYIRADGSIDPPTPLITTADNVTYTFTDNIYDEIVVERNNTVIDGNGHTLQGTGAYASKGINLSSRSNITSKNTNIKDFSYGILLSESSNISITGNNITNNRWGGIGLWNSRYNSISGNHITNNSGTGIELTGLCGSSNNSIVGNYIINNRYGIESGAENSISGNTITNNTYHGIELEYSYYGSIVGNSITNNGYGGIYLHSSNYNNIAENDVTNNSQCGILLYYSSNNSIYHNNLVNNTCQIYDYSWDNPNVNPSINNWDNGYPSGGNYWSDYNGTDANHDGVGDTPYNIDANSKDNFPLMSPCIISEFPSLLIPPLFMIATLPAVVFYKRKYSP